ncbi:HEAT repeat domain-containing protein [Bacillus sp. S13(2024)]|uniref:HEAT repeat domain-containing protein n=1 Tax=unclassified Bacillus (in: firmicutes) TaxID=185979 RepID=UPI003D2094DF
MNREKALQVLKKYSPMPDDENLTEEMIDEYASAITYFEDNPHPSCIESIMMTFSLDDCYGVYEHATCVLREFSNDEVVPHLIRAIQDKHEGRRYWGTELAKFFPDVRLVSSLLTCIDDPNDEIREYVASALSKIGDKSVLPILHNRLLEEYDEDVCEELKQTIWRLEKIK